MFINFMDRSSLAIATPLLQDELKLSSAEMGTLLSAFFWTYCIGMPLAGWLAHRHGIRWLLAGSLLLWSVATFLCGLATSFSDLLILRLIVGLGESATFPIAGILMATLVPGPKRGKANAIGATGMYLGPATGLLIGGFLMPKLGWPAVFFATGAISLLWLVPWFIRPLPDVGRESDVGESVEVPRFIDILLHRKLWALSIGQFCYGYQLYLLLSWVPTFLVKEAGFSVAEMAGVAALASLCQAAGALLSGTLSDRWIGRGGDTTRARRSFLLIGLAGGGLMLALTPYAPRDLLIFSLCGAALFCGSMTPIAFTVGQSIAGPMAAGPWIGVQTMVGNFAGILAPIVTGYTVQATGSFTVAFLIAAAIAIPGLIAWGPMTGSVQAVRWARRVVA